MDHDGTGFKRRRRADASCPNVIVPADIQITGDGAPCVWANARPRGAYPRIGRHLPATCPRGASRICTAESSSSSITLEDAHHARERSTVATSRRFAASHPADPDPAKIRNRWPISWWVGAISAPDNPFEEEK